MFFKLHGENIPLLSTGTSTFIGAGQFGKNASAYRKKFLYHRDAMLEILEASYEAGGRGVEVIPMGKICEAAKIMKESHEDYVITGSTLPGPHPLIEDLVDIGAKIIFVHAMISDRLDKKLQNLLEDIKSRGVIPGIAVHSPIRTLQFAFKNFPNIKTFLIPFNADGFIMGNQKQLEKIVDGKQGYYFIGMKTLAAGKLSPEIAFKYVSKHNITAVTVGMVTVKEARESTRTALEYLIKKKNLN